MNYTVLNASDMEIGDFRKHAKEIQLLLRELTKDESYIDIPEQEIAIRMKSVINRGSTIFIVQDEMTRFVGMATLVYISKLTGLEGEVHDVVTDPQCQGQCIGKMLMMHLIRDARSQSMKHIALTSNPNNPNRAIARRLYQNIGFVDRDGYMRLTL
jgi:ribosomal protein S18 acetylase RimI-like enzyme